MTLHVKALLLLLILPAVLTENYIKKRVGMAGLVRQPKALRKGSYTVYHQAFDLLDGLDGVDRDILCELDVSALDQTHKDERWSARFSKVVNVVKFIACKQENKWTFGIVDCIFGVL